MGIGNQQAAPFFEGLCAVAARDGRMFSTPGHKQGRGAPDDTALLAATFALDIPHGGGVDTTQRTYQRLRAAERLAAEAYGGDDARFLVNGSSTGNLAMLLATCRDGDDVIVSRMLHRSLLAALIFCGARPIFVAPALDLERNLPLDIAPSTVADALDRHPAAKAVALVSPSYVGVSSDLPAIARLCQARGVPLLIDEAWGPHFGFHPSLPPSAMQAGADAGVSSTHKMLASLTQGSTLVARRGLLDLERLHTMVDMVQTTSPSALIYASLDASRRQMALHGEALLTRTLAHAARLREELAHLGGLQMLSPDVIAARPGAAFDPTRLIVDVHEIGLTGYEAELALRERHGIYVEMSDLLSVELLVTIGDGDESIERAIAAFRALVAERRPARHGIDARSTGELLFAGEQVLTPREAFSAPAVALPVADAVGRISTEVITPYPPGIPLVTPGERISAPVVDYLRAGIREGMYVSGVTDASLETLRVVR